MARTEHEIDVELPVTTVYDQWTQFEQFPAFMKSIRDVQQLDPATLHWRARIFGRVLDWSATIVRQDPDQCVSWVSTGGAPHAGSVAFIPLAPKCTRIAVLLDYPTRTLAERSGAALGIVSAAVRRELKRFKRFVERGGRATGTWRGAIHGDHITDPVAAPRRTDLGERSHARR